MQANNGPASLSLAVRIPAANPTLSVSGTRALLPGTETITLTVSRDGTILYTGSPTIAEDLTASLSIDSLPSGVTLTVSASAADSNSTYASGQTDLILQEGANSLSLALIPSDTVAAQAGINRNLSGLASANRVFRMTTPLSGQWTLQLQPTDPLQVPARVLAFGPDGRALSTWNEGLRTGTFSMAANSNLYLAVWDAAASFNLRLAHSPDGVRESSFGNSGSLYSFGSANNIAETVADAAVLSDGRIVVAGMSNPGQNTPFLALLTADGLLDSSFDLDGVLSFLPLGSASSVLLHCAVDASNRILAAGTVFNSVNDSTDWFVCRFLLDGALDTSFGSSGYTFLDPVAGAEDSLAGMELDSTGRIVLAGKSLGLATSWSVARLSATGLLDTSFATNGVYSVTVGSTSEVHDFIVGPADDIIVLGTDSNSAAWLRLQATNGVPYIGDGWLGSPQTIAGVVQAPRQVSWHDSYFYLAGPNSSSTNVYRY
ncbi:MAG: hypothetical protein KKC64_07905, partial [Spirochaetes bacterium]|nr:hypothetical protein [Spirochaetota bacterium]